MSWGSDDDPELGDIVFELPATTRRAYEVVGVEEPARGERWGIVLERLDFAVALRRSLDARWWCYTRDRR